MASAPCKFLITTWKVAARSAPRSPSRASSPMPGTTSG